ncbi:hypothetical protein [Cellulomonas endometrii]|uniref:hypothetical protein n=1 Tax=Cellulomonas endometrii TaxID=3036301 RepID=UPI0024AD5C05|nr:hypothetical protein [Cellulomonas endometrii]
MTTMREVAEDVARRTGVPYERVLVAAEEELVALGYDVPREGVAPDFRFDTQHLDVVIAGVEAALGVSEVRPAPVQETETDDL